MEKIIMYGYIYKKPVTRSVKKSLVFTHNAASIMKRGNLEEFN